MPNALDLLERSKSRKVYIYMCVCHLNLKIGD